MLGVRVLGVRMSSSGNGAIPASSIERRGVRLDTKCRGGGLCRR